MHPAEKAALFHELGRLVHSGTAFPKAVGMIARHMRGGARSSLDAIGAALARGSAVGESLAAGTPLIGALESCVLSAGDRAGRLDAGLEQLSQYHGALAAARSRIRARLAYPVFVLHFALLVLPLPVAFAADGGLIPYLRAAGAAIGGLWLGIIAAALLIRSLVKAAAHSAAADRLLRGLPLFGKLRRGFALGRFCSAYQMQLGAGVNVLANLETSGAASGSAVLRDAVAQAMPAVRSGGQVGPALEKAGAFPAEFIRAFAIGEETGELDRELQRTGAAFHDAAMRRLETISEWVPRLIYIAILAWIGWRIVGSYTGQIRDIERAMEQ